MTKEEIAELERWISASIEPKPLGEPISGRFTKPTPAWMPAPDGWVPRPWATSEESNAMLLEMMRRSLFYSEWPGCEGWRVDLGVTKYGGPLIGQTNKDRKLAICLAFKAWKEQEKPMSDYPHADFTLKANLDWVQAAVDFGHDATIQNAWSELKADARMLLNQIRECQQLHVKRIKELEQQQVFEAAFAEKLKEFGTIDRLIQAYSDMKQQHRESEQRIKELETALESLIQAASYEL